MLAHFDFKTVPGSCYSGQAKWPIVSSGGFREGSWGVPGVPWNPSFEGLPLKFYAQTYYIHHAHTGVIQKSRFHSSNNPQLGLALSHPTETISEVRNPKFCLGGGIPPDPPSRHSMYALITYWNPHFKNSRSATGEITRIKKLQPSTCINSWQINFSFIWLWQVLSSSSSSSSCRMGSFSHRITWLLPERICPCKTMVTYCNYSPEFLVRSALYNSTELQIPWKQKEQSLVCAVVPIWYGSW